MRFATMAAHPIRPDVREEPLVPPIYQTSVYVQDGLDGARRGFEEPGHQVYTRFTNPNAEAFAAEVARLEGARAGATFASGMGALLAGVLALVGPSRTVVVSEELYGGTFVLADRWFPTFGLTTTWVSPREPLTGIPPGAVVVLESLTNPHARPVPLRRRIAEAKAAGARVLVDNTFATPFGCRPLAQGADLSVHSATKALSGHGQVSLGVVLGDTETVAAARRAGAELGLTPDPFACWLASAGLRTFALRQERQVENARRIAAYLAGRPEVLAVSYAGLPDSPDRPLLDDYLSPGALLAFRVRGGRAGADRFLRALRLIAFAPSLGDLTTTVLHPDETSHRALPPAAKARLGITPDLIRLSAGIEDYEDLEADLAQALQVTADA